jgi:hypothetical protein
MSFIHHQSYEINDDSRDDFFGGLFSDANGRRLNPSLERQEFASGGAWQAFPFQKRL